MLGDKYIEKTYKGQKIAVFKSSTSKVWSLYVDKKYLAKIVFYEKDNAFDYLKGYVDGQIDH